MAQMRIQKVLSDQGILSRRKVEEYIAAGRITVNGHPAQPGNPLDPARDVVAIDGQRVYFARKKQNVYLALYKPRGFVTTTSDELGRRCVTELVTDAPAKVYPVGRLDRVSEGLLLMTNDGEFANLIMHPSHHVKKTYRVTIDGDVTEDQLIALSVGVEIGDGERTAPCTINVLEKEPGRTVLQFVIEEGKNRQIRRMCEAVHLEVARLKRTAVGPIRLGMLQPGKWRELTPAEVGSLRNASGDARPAEAEAPQEEPAKPERSHSPKNSGGYHGKSEGGYHGKSEGGYRGKSEGGYQGKSEGGYHGKSEGGYHGKSEGGYHGKSEGGYQGKSEGGYHGKSEGGYHGKSEGGYHGKSEGGYHGKSEGGYRGKSEGGYHGKSEGGYHGKNQGGAPRARTSRPAKPRQQEE